jgi:6-phosphogluconolactonase (cycloisomerase 2 family)
MHRARHARLWHERRFLAGAVAAVAIASFVWAAASGAATHVYVANYDSKNVSQFKTTGGLLEPLTPNAVGAETHPDYVAVSPAGTNVYVTNETSATVDEYSVAAGGELSPIAGSEKIATGGEPEGIATAEHGGEYAYVATEAEGKVYEYETTGPVGALKKIGTAAAGGETSYIATSPDGKCVYATNYGSSTISEYEIQAGGTLMARGTDATNGEPLDVIATPDEHVYVANRADETVSQYSASSKCELTPLANPTVKAHFHPRGIAYAEKASGVYVYVTNEASSDVSVFKETGELSFIENAPTELGPADDAATPDGEYLYVTNAASGTVSQFHVAAGGELEALKPASEKSPTTPWGIAVDAPSEAPHWYSEGTRLKPGQSELVATKGLVTIHLAGEVEITCKVKDSESIENPVGGGAGIDQMLAFSLRGCKVKGTICKAGEKIEVNAGGLPWATELQAGPPITDAISGMELKIECFNKKTKVKTVFDVLSGTLTPTVGNSVLEFGLSSGVLAGTPPGYLSGNDSMKGPPKDKVITAHTP